ncbi:MAG: HNH endonuclease [Synechococcus sp.]
MVKYLSYYIKKITMLRVDRSRGIAPYQPLLILSLLETIEQGLTVQNKFFLGPELISVFIKYRNQLSSSIHQADPAQPFFHMSKKKGSFWHLKPKAGHEHMLSSKIRLNSLKLLRENVEYGYFDSELFRLLQDPISRNSLTAALVQKWFPDKLDEISNLLQIRSFERLRRSLKEAGGAVYSVEDSADDIGMVVRDAAFRRNIVSLYEQRCAFCKVRVIDRDHNNIVDGAHIKPFSEFRDNLLNNGISLCKNHHWAFDRGWFGINDNYEILIPSDRFHEESPQHTRPMKDFAGEVITLPLREEHYPRPEALQWHRDRWGI